MSGSMPRRVQEETRRYLECGQLRYGFLEVRCEECRRVELVAFSCKGRGWCPTCTTRRSLETGAHVEATLPVVGHRQWTLSLARTLRLWVLKEPGLFKLVEKALVRAVWWWQRAQARGLGASGHLEGGAVAMVQYFGSHLQVTPHLHVLVAEAVWDVGGRQVVVPPPDDAAVEAVLRRLLRQVAKTWPTGEPPWAEDEYQRLQEEAVQERLGLPVESRPRRRLVAVLEGFSLHAGTWVHGNDRQGLERLARYGARGPVAEARLRRLDDGRYEYTPKGDGLPLVLTAGALMKRLAALLPPPRKHLTTFHGVYGPNSKLRPLVVSPANGQLDAGVQHPSLCCGAKAKTTPPRLGHPPGPHLRRGRLALHLRRPPKSPGRGVEPPHRRGGAPAPRPPPAPQAPPCLPRPGPASALPAFVTRCGGTRGLRQPRGRVSPTRNSAHLDAPSGGSRPLGALSRPGRLQEGAQVRRIVLPLLLLTIGSPGSTSLSSAIDCPPCFTLRLVTIAAAQWSVTAVTAYEPGGTWSKANLPSAPDRVTASASPAWVLGEAGSTGLRASTASGTPVPSGARTRPLT